eukprot:scaffold203098_cov35-Tisochrysis_lutea.AAC.2
MAMHRVSRVVVSSAIRQTIAEAEPRREKSSTARRRLIAAAEADESNEAYQPSPQHQLSTALKRSSAIALGEDNVRAVVWA